jgi:pseudouridine-5'-phosphate glycosidase
LPTAAINQHGCRVSLKSERLEVFGRNEASQRDEDRLVAYKIDARSAKETMTAGTMVCSEKALCYLV